MEQGIDPLITRADVQDFFPELAESEDEKIRKELTKHLKELSDWKEDEVIPVKNPSYYRQWASWLEKQGEKLPAGFYYVNSEGKKFYSDTFKYGDVILHVEKQGADSTVLSNSANNGKDEQKPEENKGNIGGISDNSEWSEEDEVGLGDALWAIKQARTIAKDENDMGNLWCAERWLKSLKGRVQPQWKPSDVQIECLSDAIEHYNSLGYPAPKLKELLDDLKKLKRG